MGKVHGSYYVQGFMGIIIKEFTYIGDPNIEPKIL